MTMTIDAVYSGGVLCPAQPLSLREGEIVAITIHPKLDSSFEDEIIKRIQGSKTYHEWLEVMKSLPADNDGYDIVKAIDENRRWSGERPVLPDPGTKP